MSADSSTNFPPKVLEDLEPLGRALLDLSLKRGMSDAEIADVLGTDADSVLENRVALMRAVADQVAPGSADADVPELEAIVAEHLYSGATAMESQAAEPEAEPEPEPLAELHPPPSADSQAPTAARPARRRSPLLVLLPLLLLGALVGAIIGLANTGDDSAPAPSAAKPLALAPLAGHSGRGSATIDGDKLHLSVSGLPNGAYDVWLYNSIVDARPIGRLKAPAGALDARLPANWHDYRSLDVSLEPPDGNPNHSGQSVLRAPLGP